MNDDALKYDYAFDPDSDTTPARICRQVGHGLRVLELGCAAGAMSAVLQRHYDCTVVGVDQSQAALAHARPWCEAVVHADLNDTQWLTRLPDTPFDCILAADVLEHLRDPQQCLQALRPHLHPQGRLVVSVPNVAHAGLMAALLNNDFPYRETGLLDRTHIHFFTSATLGRMLHACGFAVTQVDTADAGPEHEEFRACWQALPTGTTQWLAQLPAGRAYQILMTAQPSATPGAFIDALGRDTQDWLHDNDIAASALRDALHASQDALAALRAQLQAMQQSHSWRLTAPLRWLMRRLR